jgi:Fur family ferric uptake transcriptional regulator
MKRDLVYRADNTTVHGAATAAAQQSGHVEPIGRSTRQRTSVLRALIDTDGFVSAQALYTRLLADGLHVGLSTVYRTLTALTEAGRADMVREPSGERLYRYRPSEEHRHYLLCRRCGLSLPVDSAPVEAWSEQVSASSRFTEIEHTVELTGICDSCTGTQRSNRL